MEEQSTLEELLRKSDERIAELEKMKELGEALERLHENEDFQKVILDGYFEKEAKRLFDILVHPDMFKRDIMQNIQDKLTSIRSLKQFFGTTLQNAHMAPMQIEEEENYKRDISTRNPQEVAEIEGGE
jgi:hemerythrin superfamily protein